MKIYLVGFMGAGKTTVGRELAARLDVPFFDLDGLVDAAERPLFRDDVAAHPLFRNRLRYYRMADVALDVREEETIAEIVERLLLELPKSFLDTARRPAWRTSP